MSLITLGFKAFDAHELLCHFVAVKSGLYKKKKLQVDLVDITFIPERELPRCWFQASCGAALTSAVKEIPQRLVFVAIDKPMFWIYTTCDLSSVGDLRNKRLATFPAIAPPHHLANIILAKAGLSAADNVTLYSVRDDIARLGLLKSGHVDAAVISSAIAPTKLAALGYRALCFFGDEIRFPTTGLGIDQYCIDNEFEVIRLMTEAHQESLLLIHDDKVLVGKVLQEYFDVAIEHTVDTVRLYQSCYTERGKTTPEIAQAAINDISSFLNVATSMPWENIFKF